MKTHLSVLLLLLLVVPHAFSQENDVARQSGASSYITVSPFSSLDIYAPRLRLGYIQHVAPHVKMGVDIGYGNKGIGFLSNHLGDSYRLWEIRPEFHYVLNPKARTLKYISAELFYIDQANIFSNGEYQTENGEDFRYDRARFERQKYGMHLKFGLFLNLGQKVGLNFYGGIGFRWRNSEYLDVENLESTDVFREWYSSLYDKEGRDFGPNPSLGVKFYYRL
ncbi:hypothetical protein Q4603_07335 [Zobellia galactanivorans]|uniref:Conserved hypothetical membrane protein n=1 Tax=Zobellia galactanivorans (strain DSM 12802 / CCUG 47099 / CIP 106680 / NCIMB 13871 / Dsij) TaxID=63186 RepID=G0L3P8_ZOBGA|nr:hypothetical protein [Zobellia galactanivorans]MDO6808415.1 hypothetical protein [Zobellia galactanivorans]CAZ95387.1 Conserved hypothetical membrane protein [Zobellia galactanivorans]